MSGVISQLNDKKADASVVTGRVGVVAAAIGDEIAFNQVKLDKGGDVNMRDAIVPGVTELISLAKGFLPLNIKEVIKMMVIGK